MKIDLRKDFEKIYAHVVQRVADYPIYVNIGPGEDDAPISHMTLGYEVNQAGWVAFVFDTRPDGGPDGEWQSYIMENCLECDHWFAAVDAVFEKGEPLELTLDNGKKKTFGENDDLVTPFGEMLRKVLVTARKNRVFAELPLTKKCNFGVEHHDGYYGWPAYEKRFKDGRVV